MRGVILAGGLGSRLTPITKSISKHLIPVYDKPMIYYPLSTLMLAGIREIAIVTKPDDQESFQRLLGDGNNLNMKIEYFIQESPRGIGEAFPICKKFIQKDSVALILGDNIFYGNGFGMTLRTLTQVKGAQIFAYKVKNPQEFGVVNIDDEGSVTGIEEKPRNPTSNYAIPGLYFFDNDVIKISEDVEFSQRGELEITSILNTYLNKNSIICKILPRGTVWLDGGTIESLQDATNFVGSVQQRTGMKIACIEEIAWRNGWINDQQIGILSHEMKDTEYGIYLASLLEG